MGFVEDMSPLGNATALDCANYCVAMFSDLTRRGKPCKICLMTWFQQHWSFSKVVIKNGE